MPDPPANGQFLHGRKSIGSEIRSEDVLLSFYIVWQIKVAQTLLNLNYKGFIDCSKLSSARYFYLQEFRTLIVCLIGLRSGEYAGQYVVVKIMIISKRVSKSIFTLPLTGSKKSPERLFIQLKFVVNSIFSKPCILLKIP